MSESTPLFSVVIPNWNGAHHLPTCLNALRAQTYPRLEVIVADNASTRWIARTAGRTVSRSACGRPAGESRLYRRVQRRDGSGDQGDFVALLNNDTEVDPGWAAAVVDAFNRHPEAGLVASKMLLFDERDRFHTAGDLYRVDGRLVNRGVWEQDDGQYDQEEYVFSACGGSSAYRRGHVGRDRSAGR